MVCHHLSTTNGCTNDTHKGDGVVTGYLERRNDLYKTHRRKKLCHRESVYTCELYTNYTDSLT